MKTPPFLTPKLAELRRAFQENLRDIRFVGGCVRDWVAGAEPKDVDLCTDATPDEQVAIYNKAGVRYVETGLQHGTITVVLDDEVYEITSLRIDVNTDGRHAEVVYTQDWLKDLSRRDFTFNAMSLTFDGELIDPFNGKDDLAKGIVRFVGDPNERIIEDYLRILRWFRFRARFEQTQTDEQTAIAIRSLAHGLKKISRERIWSEVSKMLTYDQGENMLHSMFKMRVTDFIDMQDIARNKTCACPRSTKDPITKLVYTIGAYTPMLLETWKASRMEINKAWFLTRHRNWAYYRYYLAYDNQPREWVVELAKMNNEDQMLVAMLEVWTIPIFPVGGNDLISLGYEPGPRMGKLLADLKLDWAESDYQLTKAELLAKLA